MDFFLYARGFMHRWSLWNIGGTIFFYSLILALPAVIFLSNLIDGLKNKNKSKFKVFFMILINTMVVSMVVSFLLFLFLFGKDYAKADSTFFISIAIGYASLFTSILIVLKNNF